MKTIIPINDLYRIELDTYSWQVSKWKNRKNHPDGGAFEGVSWHRTIQQAGESLVKRFVAEEELQGVDEIINALSAASQLVAAAILGSGLPDSWLDAKNRNTNIEK